LVRQILIKVNFSFKQCENSMIGFRMDRGEWGESVLTATILDYCADELEARGGREPGQSQKRVFFYERNTKSRQRFKGAVSRDF
jgi:hypothetical protein